LTIYRGRKISFRAIARRLQEKGYKTRRGKGKWNGGIVQAIIERATDM
jgi:hypothetical protein